MSAAENVAGKQRGRPWPKGTSGNPAGKERGTRHRVTLAAQALLDGEAESLTRRAIELAKEGDTVALRLCLERIVPVLRDRPVRLDLPAIKEAADVTVAIGKIIAAVAAGELTPDQAQTMCGLLDIHRKAIETEELERRLAAVEAKTGARPPSPPIA